MYKVVFTALFIGSNTKEIKAHLQDESTSLPPPLFSMSIAIQPDFAHAVEAGPRPQTDLAMAKFIKPNDMLKTGKRTN